MRIVDEERFAKSYRKARPVLCDISENRFYVELLEQCTKGTEKK